MRILLVGNFEPDRQQSMQRYAGWLLAALRARGVTAILIRPVALFSRLGKGPLGRGAIFKYLGYLDKYLVFPRQLRAAARQFDLVHICDHSNSMYLNAAAGVPAVITCHDVLAIRAAQGEFAATRTGWAGRRLQAWILRGLRSAKNVICVSHKTADDLARLTGEVGVAQAGTRIEVILNPLNWHYQPQPDMQEELRDRLGLPEGQKYFLHVGGNQWYKNRTAVVRIFAELAGMAEFEAAKLVMAGKPLPPSLRELIAQLGLTDRVIEALDTANEELEALYSSALALVFPSLEEGFGWPIAEAQACGCPVAVTNRPPMTEVAGDAAIFIDPEDPAGAAQLVRDGLARREELRQAGFLNVARFDEAKIADAYCAAYASMLGAGRFPAT